MVASLGERYVSRRGQRVASSYESRQHHRSPPCVSVSFAPARRHWPVPTQRHTGCPLRWATVAPFSDRRGRHRRCPPDLVPSPAVTLAAVTLPGELLSSGSFHSVPAGQFSNVRSLCGERGELNADGRMGGSARRLRGESGPGTLSNINTRLTRTNPRLSDMMKFVVFINFQRLCL